MKLTELLPTLTLRVYAVICAAIIAYVGGYSLGILTVAFAS